MSRKKLFRLNIIIVLVAAALWFVPFPRQVSGTWNAVAFRDGEAVGTTIVRAEYRTAYYLFREAETSGRFLIDAESEKPIEYEPIYIEEFNAAPGGETIAYFGVLNRHIGNHLARVELRDIFIDRESEMLLIAPSDYDELSYICFNGSYEDAKALYDSLRAHTDLSHFTGTGENPFE